MVERRKLPYYAYQIGPKIAYHKVTAYFGPEIGSLLHLNFSARSSIFDGDLEYTRPTVSNWKSQEVMLLASVVPDGWTLARRISDQDHIYFRTQHGGSHTFLPQSRVLQ